MFFFYDRENALLRILLQNILMECSGEISMKVAIDLPSPKFNKTIQDIMQHMHEELPDILAVFLLKYVE